MNIQVINKSKHPLPAYATELSAGMDIRANISEPISLAPMQRCLVPTGLFIALPQGFEAQIRPRSGLALKKGITVLNSPGTIDADYRGEICIILVNLSAETFVIEDGATNKLYGKKLRYWTKRNAARVVSDIPEEDRCSVESIIVVK